ncbi:hypothetical protein K432DRAFT_311744, partial [Lepidopterella palustris CBS 459.81]
VVKKGITAHNNYNYNETGFRIRYAKPAKMITRHPNRRNIILSLDNRSGCV